MVYNNIKALLEKYWEGTTSLEEEQTLKDYFYSDSVDPQFAEVAPLFQFFKAAKVNKLPDSFETKLVETLKASENLKETKGSIEKLRPRTKRIALYSKIASIAALFALALYIGVFMMESQKVIEKDPLAWQDTYEDPEEAYLETIAALKLISKKLKRGKEETAKGLMKVKENTNFNKQ